VIVVDDNSPDADTYMERVPELSRKGVELVLTTEGRRDIPFKVGGTEGYPLSHTEFQNTPCRQILA